MMGHQKQDELKQAINANEQESPPHEQKDKPPGRASKLPQKCPLTKCLLCTREQPYCLVRSPTWYVTSSLEFFPSPLADFFILRPAIMRVVFYVLKFDKPEREFFNLKEDVYNVMLWHWSKLSIGKKSTYFYYNSIM